MGRRTIREKGKPSPLYAANSTKFTIVMHLGGHFQKSGSQKYSGKIIEYFDFFDVVEMSMFELVDMIEILGIRNIVKVFRIASDGSILPVSFDSDVMNMLFDLPRTHHVHLYVVEEEIAKQTQNEPVNEHVSEDVFEQAETEFMFTEPSTEPQVETFSEDVFGQCETKHCSEHYTEPATEHHVEHPTKPLAEPQTEYQTEFQTEPQDEPQTQPPTEPQTDPQTQTEPQAETISEANMEPEHEPSRFDDTEPDDSQDSDYNGSSRTDSVTSSFGDIDFSVEDVSQYQVDVEMDFEDHFGTEPSATRRRVETEFESDVSDSLHSVDESDSDSGIKKKKKRLPEFNIATDMDNPDFKFILEARDKPIITLLEIIRTKIIQMIAKKKVEADKWTTTLCPKIQQKLVASIERSNRIPDEFVDQCYKTSTQQEIYSHMVQPVRGQNQWTPDETCPHLTSNPETTPWQS
ncbi:hypothetical protein GQ457_16G021030 [Hibiscus cannabinus]